MSSLESEPTTLTSAQGVESQQESALRREALELEKLGLEVTQLKQPWWRRPTYVLAGLPTLLALGSLVYGLANGYFQAVAVKLENQRHDLEIEVRQFNERKQDLERQIKALSDELQQKEKEVGYSRNEGAFGRYQLHQAEEKIKSLERELRSLKDSRSSHGEK
jgi:hypothetical protein